MSRSPAHSLPHVSRLILLALLCSIASASFPSLFSSSENPDQQLIMAEELPREEIGLLYQRLKGAGRARTRTRTNGTMWTGQQMSRKKIGGSKASAMWEDAPPLVSAVLTSSSIAPSGRTSTASSMSSTGSSAQPSPKLPGQTTSSSSFTTQIWPPSFLQISRVTAIVLVGLFFSLATTIGNALVMISICVDRKLQTISNYFLFSLAVADLTIGLISIPLMTLYTANESWSFGYALCQFWLCIDYLMCNASVLNLLLISFDRYFSVTRPLTYRPKRTTRKALFLIAATYTISLILWPPWIVLWPYMEGRFIVEENAVCVVQFLALGNNRNWRNQLATIVSDPFHSTHIKDQITIFGHCCGRVLYSRDGKIRVLGGRVKEAFAIACQMMIGLYYKVYLETRRRQKELRKLQDGQQLFSPTKLAGTSALHSLMLPLAPLIRGLQSSTDPSLPISTLRPTYSTPVVPAAPPQRQPLASGSSRINFMELVSNISTIPAGPSFKKKERFSLLKFCTGKAQTDISSEDSVEDGAGIEETGGLTISNLDSVLADQTAVELAHSEVEREEEEKRDGLGHGNQRASNNNKKEGSAPLSMDGNALVLDRTSRPSSVHTYNSIVIIEYPENGKEPKRPSVRLSSHAEVESLSARNSVERRLRTDMEEEEEKPMNREEGEGRGTDTEGGGTSASERQKLRLTKSCPSGPQLPLSTGGGTLQQQQQQQQNGLMKKSEIQMLREEQMRRSEKERRRNERKQESKAAKTLSAILFAFIITWTPYNVIVCLEAFYPNSVPASLFTLSYFLSYVNSTINPLCYALCNARFRMTYMRILQCKWGRRNSGILSPFEGAFHQHNGSHGRSSSGRRVLLKGRHRGLAQ